MHTRFPVLLILVCLFTSLAVAQDRGVIVIRVDDGTQAALPGATVWIKGPEQRKSFTNEQGEATFAGVVPGTYSVSAELPGFQTATMPATVRAGATAHLSISLQVAALTESVTVTVASPALNASMSAGQWGYEPVARWRPRGEKYQDAGDNPFRTATAEPLSTFSIDVDTASYSNVRRFLNEGTLPPAAAIRVEELINYFKFDYPQPKAGEPFSITTEVAECPWAPKHRLALIGLQGRHIPEQNTPSRNLVFLIDVSGSMDSPDKLPLVRHGLAMLAATLTSKDRVAIVVYAGTSGLVLDSTPGHRKEQIRRAFDSLGAGGSTNGGEGIRLAYKVARENFIEKGVNRVILATDGDFNVGVTSMNELEQLIERERESGVFLSVLGVGTGNINDATMELLADKGNGNYSYLDTMHEAHRVLVKEAGSTLVTIAKDVKIQVEFNPAAVSAYRLIGYENRMLRDEDFNDDRKDAGEIGAGHSVTAIYEIGLAGVAVDRPRIDPLKYSNNPGLPVSSRAANTHADELMTVKLRHKLPDGDLSRLSSAVVRNKVMPLTGNLGFASAVAEAGMLLRNSPHVAKGSYASAIERARRFRGDDEDGYRAEFARLVELAGTLSRTQRTNR